MGNLIIALHPEELRQKISLLQKTKDNILIESNIPVLQFGSRSASKTSGGNSVVSMETLNIELDAVSQKLAKLSEATSVYLERVIDTFEKTDKLIKDGITNASI